MCREVRERRKRPHLRTPVIYFSGLQVVET